ncbi:MAG: formyltransferase family protein [Bacteroidales bacterium]
MKIILLTQNLIQPPFIEDMLKEVENVPDLHIIACLLHSPPEASLLEKLRRHWKKGVRGYLVVLILQALSKKIKNKIIKKTPPSFNLHSWVNQRNIPLLKISHLYAPDTLQMIRDLNAEAAILAGYHLIVKESFINLFPKGVLSYHYGDLRKYRGQPAGFWELYNNEKEFRVTVQKIRKGIDNGIPVVEKIFPLQPHTTLSDLDRMVEKTCAGLMSQALFRIASPDYVDEIPETYGKLYSIPRLRQWLWFQWMMTLKKVRGKKE